MRDQYYYFKYIWVERSELFSDNCLIIRPGVFVPVNDVVLSFFDVVIILLDKLKPRDHLGKTSYIFKTDY